MRRRAALVLLTALATMMALAAPAAADHTDPNDPVAFPIPEAGVSQTAPPITQGIGQWEVIRNFPVHQASDVTFFDKGGKRFASQGTLGQGPANTIFVGQRMIQVMEGDTFDPDDIRWRADHGSAACGSPVDAANTGLQHDSFATPPGDPEILVDTSDSTGRCHDEEGGGIELVDISGLDDDAFEPREVHLLRFNAWSHTATLDHERPWIIFSNSSDATGTNFLDFADIRSCLTESAGGFLDDGADLDTRREECRPVGYRIPFEDHWTYQTEDGGEPSPDATPPTSCHDIVIEDNVVYCSGLQAELLLDISDLTDDAGTPRGTPLPCTVLAPEDFDSEDTGASVTDCSLGGPTARGQAAHDAWEAEGSPQATGWEYIGHYNHPGRTHAPSNSNFNVPADEGIAVSHETRPFPEIVSGDRRFMIVSDERGGGIVPGGANCTDDNFDVYNHGGLHVFDITDPDNIEEAQMRDGDGELVKAFWRGTVVEPRPTFCVVHRFRMLPEEQRIIVGYYSQGVKILDYDIDDEGVFSFEEVASLQFQDSNTWTGDVFHHVDRTDGTRTYYIALSDTLDPVGNTFRGMDIVAWTAPPNPYKTVPFEARVGRFGGQNRYETAVEVSKARYDRASTVVLARGDDYADALAGAPLAHARTAPLLLTQQDQLTGQTEAEIGRLGADTVVLLGREAAISQTVADRLRDKGLTVERVGGANRYATAARIAGQLGAEHESVFFAEGIHEQETRGWPDALSAAPYAAFTQRPVLLASHDRLPPETAQALDDFGTTETVVVGGPVAISERVFAQLDDAGHGPRRLAGDTRYETSREVFAEAEEAGMNPEILWLATGRNWPDALTAGPAVAGSGGSFMLIDGMDINGSPATRDEIQARADSIHRVNLLGGVLAISQQVEDDIRAILGVGNGNNDNGNGDSAAAGTRALSGDAALVLTSLTMLPLAALIGRRRRRTEP